MTHTEKREARVPGGLASDHQSDYNRRLFSGGLRRTLHLARFQWLANTLTDLECDFKSVLELGCFDGKAIDWLPHLPATYLGLDANWEGGLMLAKEKWAGTPNFDFRHCNSPDHMELEGQRFDLSICMETFEHVPAHMVDPYLRHLADATAKFALITVPNEIGPVFIAKHIVKSLKGSQDSYTTREVIAQAFGRVDQVERAQHKGFSYHRFLDQVRDHFNIVRFTGIPIKWLPPYFNFGVGIIARPRRCSEDGTLAE